MSRLKFLGLVAGLSLSVSAFAQEQSTTASSSNSVRPIPQGDIMYKKTVWRSIDLREKQNKPMFSTNKEISRILIEAVKSGELTPYKNDSLATPMTLQEFTENLTMPQEGGGLSEEEKAMGFSDEFDSGWGDEGDNNQAVAGAAEYFPNQLWQLELREDVIFDKKRSRMYHDIQSISLIVPATLPANIRSREILVGAFKYSDLVRVFRNHPDKAIWFNAQNDAQHKNLADAFDLWLFSSYITKVSNPNDSRLEDIYGGPKEGLLAAQRAAEEMIEFEYNLWSY